MAKGKGYMWLADQVNAGRAPEDKVKWQDLRQQMGGQMLRAGADYGTTLRQHTPKAWEAHVKDVAATQPAGYTPHIMMPWHKDPTTGAAAFQKDVRDGQAMVKRQNILLAKAREAKAALRYAPITVSKAAPGDIPSPQLSRYALQEARLDY